MRSDYPSLDAVGDIGAEEYVVSLYEQLGWTRGTEIDPRKITINSKQWEDICAEFNQAYKAKGVTAGLFWMNYGPSGSPDIPYGKIDVEPDAFEWTDPSRKVQEQPAPTLTDRNIMALEREAGQYNTEGHVIHLIADYRETNDFLLQTMEDAHYLTPEDFIQVLNNKIAENSEYARTAAIEEIVTSAGITPDDPERYMLAQNFIEENYTFEAPTAFYLSQNLHVNIILGTAEEANLDFSAIPEMYEEMLHDDPLGGIVHDNALTWLVQQQEHTPEQLKQTIEEFETAGESACREKHGPFLASVASELHEHHHRLGAVTVLAEISGYDMAKLLDEDSTITMPQNAKIGIFAPWIGAGSMLDIELEKPLEIPSALHFDLQVEGADCQEATVNETYGLMPECWKEPRKITNLMDELDKPIENLMQKAKERAAEHRIPHEDGKGHQPPEMGR